MRIFSAVEGGDEICNRLSASGACDVNEVTAIHCCLQNLELVLPRLVLHAILHCNALPDVAQFLFPLVVVVGLLCPHGRVVRALRRLLGLRVLMLFQQQEHALLL